MVDRLIARSKNNKISIKVALVAHPDAIEAFLNVGKEQKFGEKIPVSRTASIDAIDMKLPSVTFAMKHDLEAKRFLGVLWKKSLAYETRV